SAVATTAVQATQGADHIGSICVERRASSLPRRSPIVTARAASWSLRAETPNGCHNRDSTQRRAPAPLGVFILICVESTRLQMRLRSLPGRTVLMIGVVYCLVNVAEDRRFELLRGCPQHAFQACALGH